MSVSVEKFSCFCVSIPPATRPSPVWFASCPILQLPRLEMAKTEFPPVKSHQITWRFEALNHLCGLTFDKRAKNSVDQRVTLVHQFPVPFKDIRVCVVETGRKTFCGCVDMNAGKGSLCSLDVWGLSMLLSHTAWHITLISSWTEASGPKQTHTHPKEEQRQVNKKHKTRFFNTLLLRGRGWRQVYRCLLLVGKVCRCSSKPN